MPRLMPAPLGQQTRPPQVRRPQMHDAKYAMIWGMHGVLLRTVARAPFFSSKTLAGRVWSSSDPLLDQEASAD